MHAGTPVTIPQLNSNDDSAVLLEWLVADGATVTEGQPLAVLETSKSAADLEAPASGVVTQHAAEGRDYAPGHVIATIGGRPPQRAAAATASTGRAAPDGTADCHTAWPAAGPRDPAGRGCGHGDVTPHHPARLRLARDSG